jgi:hypothetical protein
LADIVILAEDTAEVAHGEEDGAAAIPTPKAILLAKVGKGAANQSAPAGFAYSCFVI